MFCIVFRFSILFEIVLCGIDLSRTPNKIKPFLLTLSTVGGKSRRFTMLSFEMRRLVCVFVFVSTSCVWIRAIYVLNASSHWDLLLMYNVNANNVSLRVFVCL